MKTNKEYIWGKIKEIAVCLSVSILVTLFAFSLSNWIHTGCLTPFFPFDDKQTNYGNGCLEDYCICEDKEDCSSSKRVYRIVFICSIIGFMLTYFYCRYVIN